MRIQSMSMCCNLALDRVISDKKNKLHHWIVGNMSPVQMCEQFHASAKGDNPKGPD